MPAASNASEDEKTSIRMQTVFFLNLMVSTSLFAIPLAAAHAGLALFSVLAPLISLMSIQATKYVIDAQGVVTALQMKGDSLPSKFAASTGEIWRALVPHWARWGYTGALVTYLVTDLAVFSVFVPESVAHVTSALFGVSQQAVYLACLLLLAGVMTPLSATSLQKTRCLQLTLIVVRHVAIVSMVIAAMAALPTSTAVFAVGDETISCTFPERHRPRPQPNAPQTGEDARLLVPAPLGPPHGLGPGYGRYLDSASAATGAGGTGCTRLEMWRLDGFPMLASAVTYALVNQQYAAKLFSGVPLKQRGAIGASVAWCIGAVGCYALVLSWTGVLAFDGRSAYGGDPGVESSSSSSSSRGEVNGSTTAVCGAWSDAPCPLQPLYSLNFGYVRPRPMALVLMLTPAACLLSTFPLVAITLRDAYISISRAVCPRWIAGSRPGAVDGARHARDEEEGVELVSVQAAEGTGGPSRTAGEGGRRRRTHAAQGDAASLVLRRAAGFGSVTRPDRSLLRSSSLSSPGPSPPRPPLCRRAVLAALAVLPSALVAAFTRDFGALVALTGGLGGVFFMLVAPAVMVVAARRTRRRIAIAAGGAKESGGVDDDDDHDDDDHDDDGGVAGSGEGVSGGRWRAPANVVAAARRLARVSRRTETGLWLPLPWLDCCLLITEAKGEESGGGGDGGGGGHLAVPTTDDSADEGVHAGSELVEVPPGLIPVLRAWATEPLFDATSLVLPCFGVCIIGMTIYTVIL